MKFDASHIRIEDHTNSLGRAWADELAYGIIEAEDWDDAVELILDQPTRLGECVMPKPIKMCEDCISKDQPIGSIVEIVDAEDPTCEWDYCVEKRDE